MSPLASALLLSAPCAVPLTTAGVYALAGLRARQVAPVLPMAVRRAPARGTLLVTAGPQTSTPVPQTSAPAPQNIVQAPRTGPAPKRHPLDRAGLLSPAVILTCGGLIAADVTGDGPRAAFSGLLRADALTAWMLLVIGAVALIACGCAPAYLNGERAARRADEEAVRGVPADPGGAPTPLPEARGGVPTQALKALGEQSRAWGSYHVLVQAFLAAMCLAVVTANLGVLWVAVEATTIVTAFLVGHRHTRASVEAAWKYVVICSAGIALAFLGTVLIYYAARQAGIAEARALDWPTLIAHADRLDAAVTRLGIALVVLGFGAKAGLVPLHSWLPDAHSQAPAPVSALMSGVLLSVAFTAVLRYKVIADAALGLDFTRVLLAGIAVLTLVLAAALLLAQRDYKRMLAYSSMEHMSLIALATAIGSPLALSAALLHIAGHGLAKSVAFCASGHILHLTGTAQITRVRGLIAQAPPLAGAFALAVAALMALPPFSLFASELGIARAGFAAGRGIGWLTAVALLLALVAFAALAARTSRMLLGPGTPAKETPSARWPLVLGLAACAALGVATGPLTHLLHAAAAIGG